MTKSTEYSGGVNVTPLPLPPLTSNYVERIGPMDFLRNSLFQANGVIKCVSKIVIITGIGGCGKTQLIRKFIEKHGIQYVGFVFGPTRSEPLIALHPYSSLMAVARNLSSMALFDTYDLLEEFIPKILSKIPWDFYHSP